MANLIGINDRWGEVRKKINPRVSGLSGSARNQLIASRSVILAQSNKTPNAAGGWRAGDMSAQAMSLDTDVVFCPGVATTKIDATGGAASYSKSFRIKTNEVTRTGPVGLWVKSPPNTAGGLSMELRWSSDTPAGDPITAPATNYYKLPFLNDGQQRGHWSFLSVSGPSGKIFSAVSPNGVAPEAVGTPDPALIKQLELVVTWNSATPMGERLLWLAHAECNGKAKPLIVIGFDGFNDSTSVAAKLEEFDRYGMVGYIAGDGASAAAAQADLDKFYDRGWPLPIQGWNHIDYAANPNLLSPDWDQAAEVMTSLGYTDSLDLFAYPFNSRSLATDAILRDKGVRLARTVLGNARVPFNTTGTIDFLAAPSFDIGQKTAAQIVAILDEAEASGSDVHLYGHQIVTTASTSTQTSRAEFNGMMANAALRHYAGTSEVVSLSQYADRRLIAA